MWNEILSAMTAAAAVLGLNLDAATVVEPDAPSPREVAPLSGGELVPASSSTPAESSLPQPQAPQLDLAQAAAQTDAELKKIVDQMQKTYESTNDFRAHFTQRFTNTMLRRTMESEGTVQFKKPGLMRWDYTAPHKKSFIVDDGKLWVYTPEDNTAMVNRCFKQDGLTASISFLWGSGNIAEQFNVSFFEGTFGEKTDHHLALLPKTPNSAFAKIILVIDPKSFRVKQSIVVDTQGNVNQFIYDHLRFNRKLKRKAFAFTPPKGTHVAPIPGTCDAPK